MPPITLAWPALPYLVCTCWVGLSDDRKAIWRFATKIQWHLGVGIVLPMTDLRS